MAARKIDGSWYVDLRWNRVRLRKRSPLNTQSGAAQYEKRLRQELATHGTLAHLLPSSEAQGLPTLEVFAERWLREYVDLRNKPSERLTKRYVLRSHLLPALGTTRLDAIGIAAVDRLAAELVARGLRHKTVNNYLGILQRLLNTAVEWEVLQKAPKIRPLRTPPPETRFLTEPELGALLASAPNGLVRTMILTAARTGLRFSELAGLRWTDLEFSQRRIWVRQAYVRGVLGTPKSNRHRFVYLPSDVIEAVGALGRDGEFVFQRDGRPVHHQAAAKWITRAARDAGLPHLSWHVLRHTYASHLAMKGAPLQAIKDLLGHSTIEMTMRYAHLSPTFLSGVAALIEPQSPNTTEPTEVGQPVGSATGISISTATSARSQTHQEHGSTKRKELSLP